MHWSGQAWKNSLNATLFRPMMTFVKYYRLLHPSKLPNLVIIVGLYCNGMCLWFKGECSQYMQTYLIKEVCQFSVSGMIWYDRFGEEDKPLCGCKKKKKKLNSGINDQFSVISWSVQSSALAATPYLSECFNWTLPLYLFLLYVISLLESFYCLNILMDSAYMLLF